MTYALGIDIGGTKIAGGIVDERGAVLRARRVPTPAALGASAVLEAALRLAEDLLTEARAAGLAVVAVGVGAGGHVDVERGLIVYASDTLPGWAGTPLADAFTARLGLPAAADNDVNALALGEMHAESGAGRPYRDVLFVAVGTGVGGALVLDGQLRRGATWAAGEIGHLVAAYDGDAVCSCGARGHLEAYAAGPAMSGRYAHLAGLPGDVDLHAVAARAQAGEALACQVIADGARVLGLTLAGLLNVLDPEALVIGGGVSALGPLWWEPLTSALRANTVPSVARVALCRAALGDAAVLIGAAWLARTSF